MADRIGAERARLEHSELLGEFESVAETKLWAHLLRLIEATASQYAELGMERADGPYQAGRVAGYCEGVRALPLMLPKALRLAQEEIDRRMEPANANGKHDDGGDEAEDHASGEAAGSARGPKGRRAGDEDPANAAAAWYGRAARASDDGRRR